jgi:GNAT superfamily N-acetyltransferase
VVTRDAEIRRATESDLAEICDVWYATEIVGDPNPPPNSAGPGFFASLLALGDLFVAEAGGAVVGFSGSISRGGVRYLTDLFVRPDRQGGGLGRALLAAAMPADGRSRATVASRDPRAVALYTRMGMRPRFPLVLVDAPAAIPMDAGDVVAVPADPGDPDLVEWDAAVGGRRRPEDLAEFVRGRWGEALWLERGGSRVGYAVVQGRTPAYLRHPEAATVGPVGVRRPEDAAAAVAAAAARCAGRAPMLTVAVPGPHPSLAPLLEAGARITGADLFLSEDEPFADPRCYLPSDSGWY